jgi:acyl-CoA dehydrogenase
MASSFRRSPALYPISPGVPCPPPMTDAPDLAAQLLDATGRVLAAHGPALRGPGWSDAAWDAADALGLPLALVPEAAGGFGIAPADGWALVRLLGRHAVALPLAETMAANAALAAAGLPLADGPAALVPAGEAGWVAWGRRARTLVVERPGVARLAGPVAVIAEDRNLAGHPRDALDVATAGGGALLELGALVRALQCAGALEAVLEMTVAHVADRVQFGRPLARFQAVQHEVARAAGEVAAASAAADLALDAWLLAPADAGLAIAAARVRIGEAVGRAAGIAHQLHGAIGFTREHALHRWTTCLWSWRDEFGTAAFWTRRLGRSALAAGRDGLWPLVTAL